AGEQATVADAYRPPRSELGFAEHFLDAADVWPPVVRRAAGPARAGAETHQRELVHLSPEIENHRFEHHPLPREIANYAQCAYRDRVPASRGSRQADPAMQAWFERRSRRV